MKQEAFILESHFYSLFIEGLKKLFTTRHMEILKLCIKKEYLTYKDINDEFNFTPELTCYYLNGNPKNNKGLVLNDFMIRITLSEKRKVCADRNIKTHKELFKITEAGKQLLKFLN